MSVSENACLDCNFHFDFKTHKEICQIDLRVLARKKKSESATVLSF